jgi:hypothetical protein
MGKEIKETVTKGDLIEFKVTNKLVMNAMIANPSKVSANY